NQQSSDDSEDPVPKFGAHSQRIITRPQIYADERRSAFTRVNLRPETKNVVQGRFEYSHSPDNRALTKPYPVTTYLVAN
ncbi:MAG TPA: hypothetical protein VFR12_03345, partial [Pyrinomonadaceae bacterium]|nr:hypothetical protein [Pyrinomonadaceae bacterium]